MPPQHRLPIPRFSFFAIPFFSLVLNVPILRRLLAQVLLHRTLPRFAHYRLVFHRLLFIALFPDFPGYRLVFQ
ncbi:hypothetical protein Gotur_030658, partial [Gossypium turneri]